MPDGQENLSSDPLQFTDFVASTADMPYNSVSVKLQKTG